MIDSRKIKLWKLKRIAYMWTKKNEKKKNARFQLNVCEFTKFTILVFYSQCLCVFYSMYTMTTTNATWYITKKTLCVCTHISHYIYFADSLIFEYIFRINVIRMNVLLICMFRSNFIAQQFSLWSFVNQNTVFQIVNNTMFWREKTKTKFIRGGCYAPSLNIWTDWPENCQLSRRAFVPAFTV